MKFGMVGETWIFSNNKILDIEWGSFWRARGECDIQAVSLIENLPYSSQECKNSLSRNVGHDLSWLNVLIKIEEENHPCKKNQLNPLTLISEFCLKSLNIQSQLRNSTTTRSSTRFRREF